MKNQKVSLPVNPGKERLLVFDILRVIFVAAIVYVHFQYAFIPSFNNLFFSSGYMPFGIYPWSLGNLAVFGVIFISGAVLEYNYQGLERVRNYSLFLFKRFIRIYPAFWMSLIFSLLINIFLFPDTRKIIFNNIPEVFFEYTGFYVILGKGSGFLNNMGWFVAAIVSLYILYPYLSRFIKKYKMASVLIFLLISYVSRLIILSNPGIAPQTFELWFPLCNLFEFCLGIYIIQINWYPKTANSSFTLRKLADLSFYVFLFHTIVVVSYAIIVRKNINLIPFANDQVVQITILYIIGIGLVLLVSWLAMIIDEKIQKAILKKTHLKKS